MLLMQAKDSLPFLLLYKKNNNLISTFENLYEKEKFSKEPFEIVEGRRSDASSIKFKYI